MVLYPRKAELNSIIGLYNGLRIIFKQIISGIWIMIILTSGAYYDILLIALVYKKSYTYC